MKREVHIEYKGKCPSCNVYQASSKPEHVDVLCWRCEAKKGIILDIYPIEGYDAQDTSTALRIETSESIITIKSYVPEIFVTKKNDVEHKDFEKE